MIVCYTVRIMTGVVEQGERGYKRVSAPPRTMAHFVICDNQWFESPFNEATK